jgi:putative nucleotidyltransferase with HDIG domain
MTNLTKLPDQTPSHTLLIVDDEPANLAVLSSMLQSIYRVRVARSGEQALRAATTEPRPDLVLLDIMMPEMDGYAVLARLRAEPATQDLPVIFVTALNSDEDEQRGLELGAVDYLAKPVRQSIALARIRLHLELKMARDTLAHQNSLLESKVAERTASLKKALSQVENTNAEIKKTYYSTLLAISAITELRGGGLGEHCRRVADLSRQVAFRMKLTDDEIQDIFVAALLHDIGMIGYSDEFLETPVSAMSRDQLVQYYGHAGKGARALQKVDRLTEVANIIRDHHEHFDGRGFPAAKSGLNIPLGARIIIAASDYDDLRQGKLTGHPLSARAAFEYLLEGRGTRYDPRVIDSLEHIVSQEFQFVINEMSVTPAHMQVGMVLTRDLMHPNGYLLLAKGTVFTQSIIDQLAIVDRDLKGELRIYVARDSVKDGVGLNSNTA